MIVAERHARVSRDRIREENEIDFQAVAATDTTMDPRGVNARRRVRNVFGTTVPDSTEFPSLRIEFLSAFSFFFFFFYYQRREIFTIVSLFLLMCISLGNAREK